MKYFFVLLFMLVSCADVATTKMKNSKNFNGKTFFYKDHKAGKSLLDVLKWKFSGEDTPWPTNLDVEQIRPASERVSKETHLTFINHSTFLIQNKNINILTDPIWSERTSPFTFIGPKRVRKPAIKLEHLPPIDIVLIGHNHYDHLDIETLKKINKSHSPKFIVGLGVERLLNDNGIVNTISLDWEEGVLVDGIKYIFVPSRHWSARGLFDKNETLWGSFIIESDKRIYFASDTGYSDHFKEQYKKYGEMDISLLPIGAYEPRWSMKEQHMNPEESVMAHLDLRSKLTIGMHFGTFKLTNEGINSPVEDLYKMLKKYEITEDKFIAPKFGQLFKVR